MSSPTATGSGGKKKEEGEEQAYYGSRQATRSGGAGSGAGAGGGGGAATAAQTSGVRGMRLTDEDDEEEEEKEEWGSVVRDKLVATSTPTGGGGATAAAQTSALFVCGKTVNFLVRQGKLLEVVCGIRGCKEVVADHVEENMGASGSSGGSGAATSGAGAGGLGRTRREMQFTLPIAKKSRKMDDIGYGDGATRAPAAEASSDLVPNWRVGEFVPVDFNLTPEFVMYDAKENLRDGGAVLVRPEMELLVNNLRANITDGFHQGVATVLHGPAGSGKTITLLTMAQAARRCQCLLVYLQGKDFTLVQQTGLTLEAQCSRWLKRHLRAPGVADMLAGLPAETTDQFDTLLELVRHGVEKEEDAALVLSTYLKEAVRVTDRPVILCVDQYNALLEADPQQNLIAATLSQWNTIAPLRGMMLFAWSASFAGARRAEDGQGSVIKLLSAFTVEQFRAVFDQLFTTIQPALDRDELFGKAARETRRYPRELARLFQQCREGAQPLTLQDVLFNYTRSAKAYFTARLLRLFDRKRLGDDVRKASAQVALQLFTGEPIRNAPEAWHSSGMLVEESYGPSSTAWRLQCPAAEGAMLEVFADGDIVRDALRLLWNDEDTRWRALELATLHRFRLASEQSATVVVPRYNLLHKRCGEDITITVRRVVKLSRSSPDGSGAGVGKREVATAGERAGAGARARTGGGAGAGAPGVGTGGGTGAGTCVGAETGTSAASGTVPPPPEKFSPGTFMVCYRGADVVDFVAFGMDDRLTFIQASLSYYMDHSTKFEDLNRVFDFYASQCRTSTGAVPTLAGSQFLYITTSTSKPRSKRTKGYSDEVYVVAPGAGFERMFQGVVMLPVSDAQRAAQ